MMGALGVLVYHFLLAPVWLNLANWLFYVFITAVFFYFCFRLADFYFIYLLFGPLIFYLFFQAVGPDYTPALQLFGINVILFFVTQFIFFGMAYIIILKDFTTPPRIAFNSLITLASTTASFWVSLFFTSLFSSSLLYRPQPLAGGWHLAFFAAVLLAGGLTRLFLPANRQIEFALPKPLSRPVKRVILLNIDGCSLKKFLQVKKPYFEKLTKQGVFFQNGAATVYRGLTNPAFASILTGTVPKIHGVTDNNLGSRVKTRALPDIVKTIIYGCVHMEQFAKKQWQVRVVSLPKYGFRADNLVLKWLKNDIVSNRARLFVADLSSVDMAGHAYGSYSKEYLFQIKRADRLIGSFINWLKAKKYWQDSLVIISSDHGMKIIDHTYLLFSEEKWVPLFFCGGLAKAGILFKSQPSIMDIAPTISYALGVDYPKKMKARVLKEIFR